MTTTLISATPRRGETCARLSTGLNRWVEYFCAALIAVLIFDVWIGIFGRYVFELPITWAEEFARYLMIWAALMAVSCGVARREHVAVTELLNRLPTDARRWLCAAIDGLAFAFFAFIGNFGLGMTQDGATQFATIFDMTMWIPFASVPISSAVVCVQLVLVGVRDFNAAPVAGETK